jgi:hypothetical protein
MAQGEQELGYVLGVTPFDMSLIMAMAISGGVG